MALTEDANLIAFAVQKNAETRNDRAEIEEDFDAGERFDLGMDDFGF